MQLVSLRPNPPTPWIVRLEHAVIGALVGAFVGVLLVSPNGEWWWFSVAGLLLGQMRLDFHPPVFWWRDES